MAEEAVAAPAPAVEPVEANESVEESQEQVEASPEEQEAEDKAAAEEAKKQEALRKKYSLKVNNKVKEVELDLGNDEEVQRYLQKALAAEEKFQEAASVRKQAEMLVQALKTNPLAVLMHPELGLDVKALAQQVMTQELEDMQKSPEQKRIEELEKALKSKEERERQLEEERRSAEMAKIQEQAYQELDDQITSALSTSELPKSPYVVKRIADAMIEAVNMGYKDITVQQIMPFVEESITSEFQRMFDEAPEQTAEKLMEKLVGKKNLDRYRKTKVARVKKPVQAAVQDTGGKSAEPKKDETPLRHKDLFKPW